MALVTNNISVSHESDGLGKGTIFGPLWFVHYVLHCIMYCTVHTSQWLENAVKFFCHYSCSES